MFDVLIVDDEPKTRRGIAGLISSRGEEWNVIAECEDGLSALCEAEAKKPHLVITDIRMPKMEGLEFIDRLKEVSPDTVVIILSGYGHFEYAQQAIKYKVFCFLLKPLDEDEFFSVLEKVKLEIINITQEKQRDNLLRESLVKYKDALFNELLEMVNKDEIVKQLHEKMNINILQFRVLLFEMNLNEEEICNKYREYHIYEDLVRDYISINLDSNKLNGYTFLQKDGRWVSIIDLPQSDDEKRVIDFAKKVIDNLLEDTGLVASVGISRVFNHLSDLAKAYMSAFQAVKNELFHGQGMAYIDGVNAKRDIRIIYPVKTEEKLVNCIKVGDLEESCRYILEIMDILHQSEYGIFEVEEIIGKLLVALTRVAEQMRVDNSLYEGYILKLEKIDRYHDIKDIEKDLTSLSGIISNKIKSILEKKINKKIEEALNFIGENYCRDISLEEVSRKIELNSSYLSSYFKSETGMSFVEYVTYKRMEKAKELLANTNLKVFEISEQLGYNDPKYFTRIFRKTVGISTSEYRQYSI